MSERILIASLPCVTGARKALVTAAKGIVGRDSSITSWWIRRDLQSLNLFVAKGKKKA